jgi:hypothetical protein
MREDSNIFVTRGSGKVSLPFQHLRLEVPNNLKQEKTDRLCSDSSAELVFGNFRQKILPRGRSS